MCHGIKKQRDRQFEKTDKHKEAKPYRRKDRHKKDYLNDNNF